MNDDIFTLKLVYKRHDRAVLNLYEFYIIYYVEGIINTAATAMVRMLRKFRPETQRQQYHTNNHEIHWLVEGFRSSFRQGTP